MFERYKARIEAYCEKAGVEIPVGFGRHDACRYGAVDLDTDPPKLVATTWTHEDDAINYLVNVAAGRTTRMLDFKEQRELSFNGGGSLLPGDPL